MKKEEKTATNDIELKELLKFFMVFVNLIINNYITKFKID